MAASVTIYEEIADLMWSTSHGAYLRSIGWDRERLICTLKTNCPDPERARYLFSEATDRATRIIERVQGRYVEGNAH